MILKGKFFLLIAALALISIGLIIYLNSDKEFIQTSSGLKYKIISEGPGPSFTKGSYVVLNMEYFDEKDSILYSSIVRGMPVTIPYNDSVWMNSGQFYEGLNLLKTGDSAIFKVFCIDLYQNSFRIPVPKNLNPRETITFYVGVDKILNEEEFKAFQGTMVTKRQEERRRREKMLLFEDLAVIDRQLEEEKIIPMETESGLRYIIHKEGSGERPYPGQKVVVHYTGTLLDGTPFDSSLERGKPYEFVLGRGMVIKGWEEGIGLMQEGAKYTFYIPSSLGYGERGSGSMIKPNSILIFTIELIEIKNDSK